MALSRQTNFDAVKEEQNELVDFEPKDDENNCDTEAITKNEEWIKKRKTDLTTNRQIETRIKRHVVLEDGKVIEDSGPIISTNTTEDKDKQETETNEKRDIGIPDDMVEVISVPELEAGLGATVTNGLSSGHVVKRMVKRPDNGLMRQIDEKRVISHEELNNYLEVEDVKHLGDFSDETYLNVLNSGVENIQKALLSHENEPQKEQLGPRTIANKSKSHKTIDSEDKQKRCLAKPDGTLVTENKKTTQHEVIVDDDLPEKDDRSTGSREKVLSNQANRRYYKQRDEQYVDLIAHGEVVGTEMRYAAETMQMDKDGSLERPGDWDSLSDRLRKLHKSQQKALIQQQKDVALLADRKDALTKRPLDFDREEETRKGETMKWLESHFGSESTASNDSRDDDGELESTKKGFFNVVIKSNQAQEANHMQKNQEKVATTVIPMPIAAMAAGNSQRNVNNAAATALGAVPAMSYDTRHKYVTTPAATSTPLNASAGVNSSKYFQGISNWSDRKETPSFNQQHHFSSKVFRDDLQETIKRNGLKKISGVVNPTNNDIYVSREDILQQKRQSLSSQYSAKPSLVRGSRDDLNKLNNLPGFRENTVAAGDNKAIAISGSQMDSRYGGITHNHEESKKRTAYGRRPSNSTINIVSPSPSQKQNTLQHNHNRWQSISSNDLDFNAPNATKCDYSHNDGRSKSYDREFDDAADYNYKQAQYQVQTRNTLKPTRNRSPSPNDDDDEAKRRHPIQSSSTLGRPTVPQRRRAIEKKLREQSSISPTITVPTDNHPQQQQHRLQQPQQTHQQQNHHQRRELIEPPPDYSPPPRSRSSSPQVDYIPHSRAYIGTAAAAYDPGSNVTSNTLTRKQNQRTRFAPTANQHQRPSMVVQTTQTTPSTISASAASTATTTHTRSSNKVGQVISNSLRRLVSKIRSASVDRKFRMKSSNSKSCQPPTSSPVNVGGLNNGKCSGSTSTTTYQQYNVIDGHIGGGNNGGQRSSGSNTDQDRDQGSDKEESSMIYFSNHESGLHNKSTIVNRQRSNNNNKTLLTSSVSKNINDTNEELYERDDQMTSPRQRYYLGEDPYSSKLYGKENNYDSNTMKRQEEQQQQQQRDTEQNNNYREPSSVQQQKRGIIQNADLYSLRSDAVHTLGRYQKSGQRFAGSTPNLHQEYRSVQTLPRKLNEHQQQQYSQKQQHSVNLMHSNKQQQQAQQDISTPSALPQYSGPTKPARAYAKVLNRSKSFNVHGLNGSPINDPSPIYIEKTKRNKYTSNNVSNMMMMNNNNSNAINNLHASQAFKSNPHLYSTYVKEHNNNSLQSGLKSPSIVNLISRSQKDLMKIDTDDNDMFHDYDDSSYHQNNKNRQQHNSNNIHDTHHKFQKQQHIPRDDKKPLFLQNLQQHAPDLYQSMHYNDESEIQQHPPQQPQHKQPLYSGSYGGKLQVTPSSSTKYPLKTKYSLDSRTPLELNKDTASIKRRGSTSNEDYANLSGTYGTKFNELAQNKRVVMYKDDHDNRRGSASTISADQRNIDSRK